MSQTNNKKPSATKEQLHWVKHKEFYARIGLGKIVNHNRIAIDCICTQCDSSD